MLFAPRVFSSRWGSANIVRLPASKVLLDVYKRQKIYLRSLVFLFVKASYDVFPDCRVYVEHSLGDGLYCEIIREDPISEEDVYKRQVSKRRLCSQA